MKLINTISEMIAYMILIAFLTIFGAYGLFMAFDISGEYINEGLHLKSSTKDIAITVLGRIANVMASGLIIGASLFLMLKAVFFWLMNPTRLPLQLAIFVFASIAVMAVYHGIAILINQLTG